MKVDFAHLTMYYSFKKRSQAEYFKRQNWGKNWLFEKIEYEDGEWRMKVMKPYKKYNPGW